MFDIKPFLSTLTNQPGVYYLLDQAGKILYIGKARHLKKRVASYFNASAQTNCKTRALVTQTAAVKVTITHTESEALILENTLIKQHQPRYNILLRDDKSYPFIYLSDHPFPRLTSHRGGKTGKGRYFGPYPHAHAVRESLNLLQKLFQIRSCHDTVYRNRSRPCLQYQIKRCSAPCVGFIDTIRYQEDVNHAILLLEGKNQLIIKMLVKKMQQAATALEFEKAAHYRDQISYLRQLQESPSVGTESGRIDVIASVINNGLGCVQLFMFRNGERIGQQTFFPQHLEDADEATLLAAFLPQYYLAPYSDIPDEIVIYQKIVEQTLLAEVLSQQRQRPVLLHSSVNGVRAHWLAMAVANAQAALVQRQPQYYRERLTALSIALNLNTLPQRLECFDVSHTQGEATVASCVVFDDQGNRPQDYRRFNIENVTSGDDTAALQQAITRRYRRSQKEGIVLPDILFVDGGYGQVRVAQTVLQTLNLSTIRLVGIAKGVGRKPGLETLILSETMTSLILPKHSPALHLIQWIRDEAHRFAITTHRQRRDKARRTSILEQIEGIGPQRRRQLLNYFGGLQGVARASVEELSQVPGIHRELAQKIYAFFVEH